MEIQTNLFDNSITVNYSTVINPKHPLTLTLDEATSKDEIKAEIKKNQTIIIKNYLAGLHKSREYAIASIKTAKMDREFLAIPNNIQAGFLDIAVERLRKFVKNERSLQTLDRIEKFLKEN